MPDGFMQICQNPTCGSSFWSDRPQLLCDSCRIPPDLDFDLVEVGGRLMHLPPVVEPRDMLDSAAFWVGYFARHPEEVHVR